MGDKAIKDSLKQPKPVKIYESLEEMPIFNFNKCLQGDLRYILKGRKQLSQDAPSNAKEVFKRLYNEFCKLTENNTSLQIYALAGEINYLETRLQVVSVLIPELLKKKPAAIKKLYIKEMMYWNFPIDERKNIEDEVQRVVKIMRNSTTKLQRKKDELDEIKKENKTEKALTLLEQKAQLYVILKVNIDIYTTPVVEWQAYWKQVQLMKTPAK